jgi:hypothetical protein
MTPVQVSLRSYSGRKIKMEEQQTQTQQPPVESSATTVVFPKHVKPSLGNLTRKTVGQVVSLLVLAKHVAVAKMNDSIALPHHL